MEYLQDYALPVLAGVTLSAATGFRMFLPLCALAWASHLDWISLNESLAWIDSLPAAVTFSVAVLVEFLGDKVPVVDHVLDAMGTVVKPVAAAVGVMALLVEIDPLWAAVIGIVAGSTTAFGVHAAKSGSRLVANASTFGFAAPVLSVIEDLVTVVLVLMAIFLPMAALGFLGVALYFLLRRRKAAEALQ